MGLQIGPLPALLSPLSRPQAGRDLPDRFQNELRGRTAESRLRNLLSQPEQPPVRLGFGPGTISPPGAAFLTLDRGVRAARELVPSTREAQAEIRARLAERRGEIGIGSRVERRVLAPTNLARNFITRLNETATLIDERLGRSPAPDVAGSSVGVNGEIFPVESSDLQENSALGAGRIRIDIFA